MVYRPLDSTLLHPKIRIVVYLLQFLLNMGPPLLSNSFRGRRSDLRHRSLQGSASARTPGRREAAAGIELPVDADG